jgi:hypothetical protein
MQKLNCLCVEAITNLFVVSNLTIAEAVSRYGHMVQREGMENSEWHDGQACSQPGLVL